MRKVWDSWGRRWFNIIIGTAMGLCLLLALLLSCLIGRVGVNKGLYHDQQVVLEIAKSVGMEQSELDRVTEALIDYLQGKRDEFQIEAVMDGELQPLYGEREIAHMVDVQALFRLAVNMQGWMTVIGVLLGFLLWLMNDETWFGEVCKGFLRGAVGGLLFMMAMTFVAAMDFNAAFTVFHQIFFNNDLWLLYETDFLIRIMPLDFFIGMAMRVAVWFLGFLAFAAALVFTFYQRWKAGGFRFSRGVARNTRGTAKQERVVKVRKNKNGKPGADPAVVSKKKKKRQKK